MYNWWVLFRTRNVIEMFSPSRQLPHGRGMCVDATSVFWPEIRGKNVAEIIALAKFQGPRLLTEIIQTSGDLDHG